MTRTNPATTHISHKSMSASRRARAFSADDLRVHARPAEPAEEAPVLDLHATVLHDLEPRGLGLAARLGVFHAKLHPQDLRTDRDRIVGDGGNLRTLAEAIDDVHGFGNVPERLEAL